MRGAHSQQAVIFVALIAASTTIGAGTLHKAAGRRRDTGAPAFCTERQQRFLIAAARLATGEGLLQNAEFRVTESKSGDVTVEIGDLAPAPGDANDGRGPGPYMRVVVSELNGATAYRVDHFNSSASSKAGVHAAANDIDTAALQVLMSRRRVGLLRRFRMRVLYDCDSRVSQIRCTAWMTPVPSAPADSVMFYVRRDFTVENRGSL